MTTAMLAVDVQRNMLTGAAPVPDADEVRAGIATVLSAARAAEAPVVWVQNDGPAGEPDEPGTAGWELAFDPAAEDLVVRKTVGDAFTADAGLAGALRDRGADTVAVVGMQSQYCVRDTSLGAIRAGFAVSLVSGAHATYDEGEPAATVAASVEAELAAAGATIVGVSEVKF